MFFFFPFMQYTGAKPEKGIQNIPLHSWTHNLRSCNSLVGIMPIVNEHARMPYLRIIRIHTRLTTKSDVYKMFVNPEEIFREGLFYMQIIQNLLKYLHVS